MIHVWAFDPGETTGWCHLSIHDGEVGVFSCDEADHQGIGNLLFDNQTLKAAISKKDIVETVFIVEKYIMNAKITQSPWSLKTTGLIEYFAVHNQIFYVEQTPSQAKNLISNDVIKRAGLYVPGKGHAMDSVRHALYFLIIKKKVLQECLRA